MLIEHNKCDTLAKALYCSKSNCFISRSCLIQVILAGIKVSKSFLSSSQHHIISKHCFHETTPTIRRGRFPLHWKPLCFASVYPMQRVVISTQLRHTKSGRLAHFAVKKKKALLWGLSHSDR